MKIKIPINSWPAEFSGMFCVGVLGLVLTCAYPGRAASPPATAADTGRATIEGRFGKVEVDTYPLAAWRGPARAVRMRFELTRGPDPAR